MSYANFAELAKWVFVDVAAKDFCLDGRKQSDSRVSVITGLHRKDVRALRDSVPSDDLSEKSNRAIRVLSGWIRDPFYADAQGQPAGLPMEGERSFSALVRQYSGDATVKAVLDELLRVGSAVQDPDGTVRLVARAYIPHKGSEERMALLGDAADLLATFDHNLDAATTETRLQLKVCYDNLPAEVMHKLRLLSKQKGQAFLEDFDQWLATHDRDISTQHLGTGRKRAGIAVYYFEEDVVEARS